MTTLSLPVFDGTTMVGAVGIDISLSELFADDLVAESADSYFFIVETNDFIVNYHPLITNPTDVRLDDVWKLIGKPVIQDSYFR